MLLFSVLGVSYADDTQNKGNKTERVEIRKEFRLNSKNNKIRKSWK